VAGVMAERVNVARVMTSVTVEIPPAMDFIQFDDLMEDRYSDITAVCDLSDAIKQKLVDKGGPLEGFVVEVTVT
jgi:hypothetical protein